MKCFIVFALVVVVAVSAELQRPLFLARYSLPAQPQPQPQTQFVPYPLTASNPQIQLLVRPQVPQTSIYNPAEATSPKPERDSTEEDVTETTTEPQAEQVQAQPKNGQRKDSEKLTEGAEAPLEQGVYYIYHPSGLLQKVDFSTTSDAAKMAYIAQLKYQNVEPISAPIYTYDPESLVLQQVRL